MDIFVCFFEVFKYGKFERFFGGIPLGSEDGILLGFLVGASVGSSKIFQDSNLDGTVNGTPLGEEGILYPVV